MSTSGEALRALRPLAVLQAGVVSREQAGAHGVSPRIVARLVDEGHWQRLDPGLYLTSSAQPDFAANTWAGVLAGGGRSRIGDLAAARLHGLTETHTGLVRVLVPHALRRAPGPGWEFVRERDGVRDARSLGSPPRTTVEDTVLDVCSSVTTDEVVGWVTVAVQRRRTTPLRLRRALDRRQRHPRRALLADLLADVQAGAESPLEVTYLRDVERAHGLSALVTRQRRSRRAVRDVWYVDFGVVVELDGRRGHEELGRFRDMDRDNVAGLDGLLTLRFGAADLYGRPCGVAAQVATALRLRGWTGLPNRCPHCSSVPTSQWG